MRQDRTVKRDVPIPEAEKRRADVIGNAVSDDRRLLEYLKNEVTHARRAVAQSRAVIHETYLLISVATKLATPIIGQKNSN
jgi:hypothetical protein